MIRTKKISNEVVRPIPRENIPEDRIKGNELFSTLAANIFLLAKKRSGKTSVINKILKKCIDKHTKVFIFASTAYKDDNWKYIIKWLSDKKIDHEIFLTIKKSKKENNLTDVLNSLKVENDDPASDDPDDKSPEIIFEDVSVSVRKKRKPKKVAPENVFIFDDLGESLRNSAVNDLLKTNFHYKAKVIISSQYLNDLKPEALKQLDYVLVFQGNSEKKLMELHKGVDLSLPFESFLELYNDATKEKYHFLYVDARRELFRKDFQYQYEL